MPKDVDMNARMAQFSGGHPLDKPTSIQLSQDISSALDQIFDLIFRSSKQVLGGIHSIGIKYGYSSSNPDNLLVVFPKEVIGLESWYSPQQKYWRYERELKVISKNGDPMEDVDKDRFVLFVQQGLAAMGRQDVSFSKNITTQELDRMIKTAS